MQVGAVRHRHQAAAEHAAVSHDAEPKDTVQLSRLSAEERAQLGTPSNSRWHPSAKEWKEVRSFLFHKSVKRDPTLKPEMTAYTPGETLELMKQPAIRKWHEQMRHYKIPKDVMRVIFVPCAATKPWDTAHTGIYGSYNRLREEMAKGKIPSAYFVTVSEPLGVVPQDEWGRFPTYDDPGLFRNDSARAGRTTTKEWLSEFGKNFVTPFDENAYDRSIDGLSDVIADFARANAKPGREFISFVDDADGIGTHTDMLHRADAKFDFMEAEDMHPKRSAPREEPYGLIKKVLVAEAHEKRA